MLWKVIPKDILAELQTLRLGSHMVVIQFNKGFGGLIDVLNQDHVQVGANTEISFAQLDEERVTARGLLTTDHVILNHGQVTWMTPELAPLSPNYHTTPTGKRFNSQQILRALLPYTEDFGKRNMPGKRSRRHFSQLSEFERGLIIGMKTAGWSTCRVVGQVDRSECDVRNCWEQWTRIETHTQKTGSGATRKTPRREDRRIERQALVDPTLTRSTVRPDVGIAIVPQTISRRLTEANLKSKRPFCALPLTPEHLQLRLQWCPVRSMWNVTDWQNVVFIDESRFVLRTDDNCVRVWRCPGHFLNGHLGAIFIQGNARPHTARVAHDFLRHFQTSQWPARSPD
ncbi:transposable element Tc1 transposase [Trichonephila clavipes]|nr:transposable element Tc1 transposase [Trichonephila clavipes]